MNIPNGINSTQPSIPDKSPADALANTSLSANPLNLEKVVKPTPAGSTTRAISEYLKSIQSAAAVETVEAGVENSASTALGTKA